MYTYEKVYCHITAQNSIVIYVYIIGHYIHYLLSSFGLGKMKESYVPKTPLLRKVKAEFWLISQNT